MLNGIYALSKQFERATAWLAGLAGLILIAMSIMTVISVAGRYTMSMPVRGDTEIIQMFTAVVVSFSFPFCQMRYGNVIVDVFTANASQKFKNRVDSVGDLLLAILMAALAVQAFKGGMDAGKYGNESMMLRMKESWFYYSISFGCGMTAIAGFLTPFTRIKRA